MIKLQNFVDRLHSCGWQAPNDAQHTRIAVFWAELNADHLAALEAAVKEKDDMLDTLRQQYPAALKYCPIHRTIGVRMNEEVPCCVIARQNEQIAALTAERDLYKEQRDNLARKTNELTEELRLSGLRGDSLDRVVSESTDEYVVLQAENKLLRECLFPEQLKIIDALKEIEGGGE